MKRIKTGGRVKGVPNRATVALREWSLSMLDDPEWRESARKRCIAGKAPHIETHFLNVGLPKPSASLAIGTNGTGGFVLSWQSPAGEPNLLGAAESD